MAIMRVDPKSAQGKQAARDRVRQLMDPAFTATAAEASGGENRRLPRIGPGRMPPDGPRVVVKTPSGLRFPGQIQGRTPLDPSVISVRLDDVQGRPRFGNFRPSELELE